MFRCAAILLPIALAWSPSPASPAAAEPQRETPTPGTRPCRPASPDERFQVDFEDVPLGDLARLVSCAAERNFIFQPPTLAGRTVTTVAPRPVSLAALERLFESVVVHAGLELERRGGFTLIRPATGAPPGRSAPTRPAPRR